VIAVPNVYLGSRIPFVNKIPFKVPDVNALWNSQSAIHFYIIFDVCKSSRIVQKLHFRPKKVVCLVESNLTNLGKNLPSNFFLILEKHFFSPEN